MLPSAVTAMFEEIRQGAEFPAVWLATRDPEGGARVRTVVLAEADLERGLLRIGTDRRHRKGEELRADPLGEVCLAALSGPVQLRLRCRFRRLEDGEAHRRLWSRVPASDQARFYGSAGPEPSPWFLGLEGEVLEIDLLDLRPEVPVRRGYRRRAGGFDERELLP